MPRKALSTPAVRHLAKKEGIDINTVHGTGKNGRVTKGDILSFINSGHGTASQGLAGAAASRQGGFVAMGPKIAALEGITEKDT